MNKNNNEDAQPEDTSEQPGRGPQSQSFIGSTFMAFRDNLARAVSRIVPPKEIEDIVQETYVRVCQVKADDIRHPRAFMMRTARNLALDHIKRAESRLVDSMDDDDSGLPDMLDNTSGAVDQTFEQVASSEEFAHFCDAVRQLPVQCRKVFVLKKVYGYSQKEIAKELGISESTVEKHIATGIKRCTYSMMLRSGANPATASKTKGSQGGKMASVSSINTSGHTR